MTEAIRRILRDHGRLAAPVDRLSDDDDLFAAGLTSLALVELMLALETDFSVEFPDAMLNRGTFRTIAAIAASIGRLQTPAEA